MTGLGADTPPSNDCGSNNAWVTIEASDGSGEWLACFEVPNHQLALAVGDAAELLRTLLRAARLPSALRRSPAA